MVARAHEFSATESLGIEDLAKFERESPVTSRLAIAPDPVVDGLQIAKVEVVPPGPADPFERIESIVTSNASPDEIVERLRYVRGSPQFLEDADGFEKLLARALEPLRQAVGKDTNFFDLLRAQRLIREIEKDENLGYAIGGIRELDGLRRAISSECGDRALQLVLARSDADLATFQSMMGLSDKEMLRLTADAFKRNLSNGANTLDLDTAKSYLENITHFERLKTNGGTMSELNGAQRALSARIKFLQRHDQSL